MGEMLIPRWITRSAMGSVGDSTSTRGFPFWTSWEVSQPKKISGIHKETNHEGTNNEGSFMQKFKELGDSMELERIELEIGL